MKHPNPCPARSNLTASTAPIAQGASAPAIVPARLRVRGFSLVELTVAALLCSVGLLGLVGLQAKAIQLSIQANERTRAAQLARELVAQMRLPRSGASKDAALRAWQQRVADATRSGLSAAQGHIGTDAAGVLTITIDWQAPEAGPDEPARRYVTQARLQ